MNTISTDGYVYFTPQAGDNKPAGCEYRFNSTTRPFKWEPDVEGDTFQDWECTYSYAYRKPDTQSVVQAATALLESLGYKVVKAEDCTGEEE